MLKLLTLAAAALGFLLGSFRLGSIGPDQTVASPNGELVLRTSVHGETILEVSVDDRAGRRLCTVNTGVSRIHRWSIGWRDNGLIRVRSSDIGPVDIHVSPDGTCRKADPLRDVSPDGSWTAYTYWDDFHSRKLRLHLSKLKDPAANRTFETDIVVRELEDCARWEGNDRLVVEAEDGPHVWVRSADDGWAERR